MPLVSGLEVIERYHEDPRLRFVIISGYSDFEYAQKACRYHVVDYWLKPVTEEQLSAVLDRCAAMLQQEITTSRIVVPQHQDVYKRQAWRSPDPSCPQPGLPPVLSDAQQRHTAGWRFGDAGSAGHEVCLRRSG